jgi:hypothetical protein
MNERNEMKNTQVIGARTAKSGKIYVYDLERQTRTAYAEYMNPASKYEKVYYQVNVYVDGKRINFGFVDDANDSMAIYNAVTKVIEWDETPDEVLAKMHSRFD